MSFYDPWSGEPETSDEVWRRAHIIRDSWSKRERYSRIVDDGIRRILAGWFPPMASGQKFEQTEGLYDDE